MTPSTRAKPNLFFKFLDELIMEPCCALKYYPQIEVGIEQSVLSDRLHPLWGVYTLQLIHFVPFLMLSHGPNKGKKS
jgi:hypothetical protein